VCFAFLSARTGADQDVAHACFACSCLLPVVSPAAARPPSYHKQQRGEAKAVNVEKKKKEIAELREKHNV
jgi:hypothetical protein